MNRWLYRIAVALLFLIPAVLSMLPGVPGHGYGFILFLLPVLAWLRFPERRKRTALYALGIGLQVLAYPGPDLGFLGFVMLIPYLLAREQQDGAVWWKAAFLYGFLRALAGFMWMGEVHLFAWLVPALLSGAVFAALVETLLRRVPSVPYALRVATVWVLWEWVHSWLLTGFPWIFLSHTQYRFLPFIQSADLFGSYWVSFLLAFVQAAGLEAWRSRRFRSLAVAGALVALNLGYGAFRLGPEPERDGPGVLLVQSAITQDVKQQRTESYGEMLSALTDLTRDGLRAHPDTALIVWAETMHPKPHIEDASRVSRSDRAQRLFRAQAARDAKRFGRAAVYGVNSYTDLDQFQKHRGFNSAVLVTGEGELAGIYRKQRLLPMGEQFMPRLVLPTETADVWFAWLVKNVGYPASADLETGAGFVVLDAGPGLKCAPLICSEAIFPHLVRGAARQEGVDLILHIANHGWFKESWQQPQILAQWVFRAIETRLPFLSCANGGTSAAVDPSGRFQAIGAGAMKPGFLHVRVPPRGPETPYLRGWYGLFSAILGLSVALCLVLARRRSKLGQ